MPDWTQLVSFMDFCAVYYTTQLVRCAAFSFVLIGLVKLLDYNNSLHQMISYDDSYVYVDREAFEKFLCRNNTEGEIFIVFGGFYKLSGFSSGGETCLYKADAEDDVVRIPYEKRKDDWMVALYKLL